MTVHGDPAEAARGCSGRRRTGSRTPSHGGDPIDAVEVRPEVVEDVIVALLAEGHILIEDLPGRRKDHACARRRALARPRVRARAVHRRSAARRRRRHERLQSRRRELRVPARPDLRERRPRRRDQPRIARRHSPVCSSACRSGASPSTSRPTRSRDRSSCSRRRTRSSSRVRTRCRRRRWTAS